MSAAVDEILEKLKSLTLLEASELVKGIEDAFGVSAAAPAGGMMMAAPAAGGAAAPAEEAEEQTEFDVILDDTGGEKIKVLKEVRAITGLGLKEAKDMVEATPKPIKEGIPKEEAEEIKKKLEAVGAKVSIK